jgi:hypothetical protein
LVVISSAAGFAAIFVFSLVFILLNSNTKSGVLGTHTYTIEDAGLRERTAANDTLNYWSAIQKIDKTKSAITPGHNWPHLARWGRTAPVRRPDRLDQGYLVVPPDQQVPVALLRPHRQPTIGLKLP